MVASTDNPTPVHPHGPEAFRAQLLDAVGEAVISTDLDGVITYWNRAAEELYGWSADEVIGRDVVDVTSADGTRHRAAEIMERLRAGEEWSGEFLARHRSGQQIPIRVTDSPVFNDEGELTGIIGVSSSIREKKEREKALRKSERRLESLLCATTQVAWTADAEGNIHELSNAWPAYTGQSREEMSGWGWAEAIHPDDHSGVVAAWRRHLDAHSTCEIECRIRSREGGYKWMSIRAVPVFDDGGAFVEWIGTCSDIDARKQAESALRESEARHRTIVDTAHEGVFLFDADGRTRFVNARTCELLGYEADEIIGRKLYDFLFEDDHDAADAKLARRKQGVSETYDIRLKRRDGSAVWTLFSASPFHDESGAFAGSIGMVTDITERKTAEDAVAASRSRYERLVNHIDGIVWEGSVDVSSRQFEFTLVSDRLQQILGYDPQEWIDDAGRWITAIHEEDRGWAPTACMEASQERHDHALEYRMVGADGRVVWLRDLVRVVESEGDIVTSAGVMFDITERKEAERALLEAKERAEELANLKSAFLANMSHEIRTPLTSIIGFAEILEVERTENVTSMAKHIRDAGERLMLTIDSVMDLAQLESGSLRLHLIQLDVAEHLRELFPMFERHAQQQGLYLKLESEQHRVTAFADAGALFRVLTNLLGNALKFTSEGGVTVRLTEEDSTVLIEVADTGIGISEHFLSNLFEDFKQESEGFARSYEGVGLGLTITKRLVELMGGTIDVRSRKGKGSTFAVRLPRQAPGAVEKKRSQQPELIQAAKRARILAVEDQDDAQALILHLLRSKYDVVMTASATEALLATEETQYDLILMDINLGNEGKNGTEVLHELRARPAYADVPVIACTAYVLPGDEEHFLGQGFDAYLGKPFRKADLYSLIEKLLAKT